MLFLHGLGQLPTAWQEQVTALPTGWRAHAPWVPGLKPTEQVDFDLDRAVGQLATYLETQGVRRTHLVGLSLGAVVSLRLAATHPDLVDRLVLIAGQVSPPRLLMKAQRAMLRVVSEAKLRKQGLTKARLADALGVMEALDLHADLARVQAPTLVVVGDRDRPNQPAAKVLASRIRGARLVTLPGGHELNTESPEALNDAVFGFLAQD